MLLLIVTDDDNNNEDEDGEATASGLRTESISKAIVRDMGLWTMIRPLAAPDTLKRIVGKSRTTECFVRYPVSRISFQYAYISGSVELFSFHDSFLVT